MAVKFKRTPDPTFRVDVPIPVPGKKPMVLDLEFRHKRKDELKAWFDTISGISDIDSMLDIIVNWHNHDDEFSKESLEELMQEYPLAAQAILRKYTEEVTGAKLGN